MIPEYWKVFVSDYQLVGRYCDIPESADLSELDGGNLKLLDENEIINEANEFYPGVAVKRFGYVPVASCLLGSGAPYFINVNDGPNGNLYRIYHDAVMIDDDTYDMDEAVNLVLTNYHDLIKYISKI